MKDLDLTTCLKPEFLRRVKNYTILYFSLLFITILLLVMALGDGVIWLKRRYYRTMRDWFFRMLSI